MKEHWFPKAAYNQGVGHRWCLRFAVLSLVSMQAAWALTCTPINSPAIIVQGQTFMPAVVSGIDDISYSMVRFQWTSDGATTPVNYERIVYATHAQWLANGNKIIAGTAGSNYNVYYAGSKSFTTNTAIQGSTVSNLAANTLYHIAGQSSPDNGATFCPAVEETFTTLPFTGFPKPTAPTTFDLTAPTITGTDYTVGVPPCTDLQTCLNLAQPGDGIGIPPGTPAVVTSELTLPTPPSAIPITSLSGSVFNATAHGLTNGTLIHVGSSYYAPSPINPGLTYSVINAAADSFQVSQDGTTAVSLVDTGFGQIYVIRWPINQNYIVIHSTASASVLPPPGVRLDPVAYGANMGIIRLSSPYSGDDTVLKITGLNSFYWFKNIRFETAPYAPANETDPYPYNTLFTSDAQADHIVFDQCWFHPAPAPDRILEAAHWGGTNQAIVNSYFDNVDYWTPTKVGAAASASSNVITVPPMTFNWPGPGNTKQTCTLSSPATLTLSGSGSHSVFIYWTINPCVLTANVQTGLSASGSAFNIVSSATPAFPTTGPNNNFSVLQIGQGSFDGTNASFSDAGITGRSIYNGESATGIGLQLGPGPFMFINNYFSGEGIVGLFRDEYTAQGCLGATRCRLLYNTLNLTAQKNTITWDPAYTSSSPKWNGSWWFGRNAFELKHGTRVKYDGNVIGPTYGGLSNAECLDLFVYWGDNPDDEVNSGTMGDVEFVNNSCIATGSTVSMGPVTSGRTPGHIMQRIWLHNNLFLNNNGYTQNPAPTLSIPAGRGLAMAQGESLIVDHNTFWGQGGDGLGSLALYAHLSGGISATNNIFTYVTDSAPNVGFTFSTFGPTNGEAPAPNGFQGSALMGYLNSVNWTNNVMLATCSDSHVATPYCAQELGSDDVANAAALYPGPPATYFPNSGSTLASRVASMHWTDLTRNNFRLTKPSPYISGSHASSDGRDVGADIDRLEGAQGKVSNVHVHHQTSSGATISFLPPDGTFGCSIDYATQDFTDGTGTWTRVANAGTGNREENNVSLTGLDSGTLYFYRVNCQVMQPTGTFMTQ